MNTAEIVRFPAKQAKQASSMGYIKLHRELLANAHIKGSPIRLSLMIHLLLKATYEPRAVSLDDGHEIVLGAGQLISSRKSLAHEMGVTPNQVQAALKKFDRANMIQQQGYGKKFTIYTLVNWSKYQQLMTENVTNLSQGCHSAELDETRLTGQSVTSESQACHTYNNKEYIPNNTDVLLESESNDSDTSAKTKPKASPVPYQKIWDLYTQILVNGDLSLVAVQALSNKRKSRMKTLFNLCEKDLGRIERYFQFLYDNRANHTWIFGENDRGWKADIEFVCREDTLLKARENRLGNWSGGE